MNKIAFIGPESSGKTSLAVYFSLNTKEAIYVNEYSRIYLEKTNGKYVFEDIENIARFQFQAIKNAKSNYVFIDTELLVTLVWSEYKYKKCSKFIYDNVDKQGVDLFVLCKPDIPWEYDPLRENPYDRLKLFEIYQNKLEKYGFKYIVASGSLENRINEIRNNLSIL